MSAGTKDYYAALGVAKDATESDIKKAFRRKARETHPDVNGSSDAEEQFKLINEAYDVLSDPRRREMYDRFGTADPRAQAPDMGDIFAGFGMDDLFSVFFGGARPGTRPRTEGRDVAARVTITLEEAFTGVEKEIVLNRLVPCEECGSTGSASGAAPGACPDCGGTGQRQTYRRTFLGTMATATPCPTCSATGVVMQDPCPECAGQGRVPDREHITVEIPPGVDEGMQVRIAGAGEAGIRGARTGDLIVTVHVQPHEFLHRRGDDVHARTMVGIAQAALGTNVVIPGLGEEVSVDVHAGVQHGETMRVRGKGMPRLRGGGRGDLIVHIGISVPKKLDKRQRELLEELADSLGDGDQRSTLQKLRDWLVG